MSDEDVLRGHCRIILTTGRYYETVASGVVIVTAAGAFVHHAGPGRTFIPADKIAAIEEAEQIGQWVARGEAEWSGTGDC